MSNDEKGICCPEGERYQRETHAHGSDHPGACLRPVYGCTHEPKHFTWEACVDTRKQM